MKKTEEGSDKNERGKKKRDNSKEKRSFLYEIFSNFHKNISVASEFTDRNSHGCVIIMHFLFSKGHATGGAFG
jgi:hypothetical protein